jgi:hypothetical protein
MQATTAVAEIYLSMLSLQTVGSALIWFEKHNFYDTTACTVI